MIFTAKIRRGSAVDKLWRGHGRCGGNLCGAIFRRQGQDFVAESFDSECLASLQNHMDVAVEAFGSAPAIAALPPSLQPELAAPPEPEVEPPSSQEPPVVAIEPAPVVAPVELAPAPSVTIAPEFRARPRPQPQKGKRR